MGEYDTENITCPISVNPSALKDKELLLHTRKTSIVCGRVFFTVLTLTYFVCLFTNDWQVGVIGIIPFGICAIYCWCSDWIEAYVTIDGISTKPPIETFIRSRKRLIPWSEIASCKIITIHSKYGEFARRYPVLKDSQGKFVFDGVRSYACQEDLDQLIEVLKAT